VRAGAAGAAGGEGGGRGGGGGWGAAGGAALTSFAAFTFTPSATRRLRVARSPSLAAVRRSHSACGRSHSPSAPSQEAIEKQGVGEASVMCGVQGQDAPSPQPSPCPDTVPSRSPRAHHMTLLQGPGLRLRGGESKPNTRVLGDGPEQSRSAGSRIYPLARTPFHLPISRLPPGRAHTL
jgi:hypothetical protein